MPVEDSRGGLGLLDVAPGQGGVGGLDEFPGWQGSAILADVEYPAEARDDDWLSVGVGGRDGLVDERTGLDAQVGDGRDEGSLVFGVDHKDLHVTGNLADEHSVAPLLDDEGEVELTDLSGGVPAEFAGTGVDGEGGGTA